jgi:hypothetical protein
MIDKNTEIRSLRDESVETLILMSKVSENPYRSQAIKELRRRGIAITKDRLADAFMLLL